MIKMTQRCRGKSFTSRMLILDSLRQVIFSALQSKAPNTIAQTREKIQKPKPVNMIRRRWRDGEKVASNQREKYWVNRGKVAGK